MFVSFEQNFVVFLLGQRTMILRQVEQIGFALKNRRKVPRVEEMYYRIRSYKNRLSQLNIIRLVRTFADWSTISLGTYPNEIL